MAEQGREAFRTLAVVLAAGQGTRMRSSLPKVLHQVAGRSMLGHVLAAVRESGAGEVAVVASPDSDAVAVEARRSYPEAGIFIQEQRLGTGHAVLQAAEAIATGHDAVVVLYADTPLVLPETIRKLRDAVAAGAAVAALGFEARDPTGYGRFLVENGELTAIREHKDASEKERKVTLCNAGLMALEGRKALDILNRIGNANAQKEFYLTDCIEIARTLGLKTVAVTAPEDEVMGVDDRVKLATAEGLMQRRLREKAMRGGATLVDPQSVFFSHDTKIGQDVTVEPNVFFGNGVTIGDGAIVHASCHIEGAEIGEGVHVGPFARLRPGARLAKGAKVGNFCEIKNANLDVGAKVNHLAYIGDADVGAKANIGAGTITCNYDGYFKHRTVIGPNAFVGSNSSIVAPVTIGKGAYIGSGSVVTKDVPDGALALTRAEHTLKPGWADRYNATMAARKASKGGEKGD